VALRPEAAANMSFRRSASQFFSPNHHPTVVIKVGTSSLIRAEQGSLNLSSLASIVETARDLKALGFNVIIVSR
jgi:glutamate 5-kinase